MAVGAGNAAGANSGIVISGVDGTPDGFDPFASYFFQLCRWDLLGADYS